MTDAWRSRHNRRLLQRHGALPRQLDHILCVNAYRSPGRAGANTCGPAFQARAHITFHGGLGALRRLHAPQPLEQGNLLLLLRHLDDAIRTVLLTVPAPDAGVIDEDLTVGKPVDGGGRAIPHAMRVLAVTARSGQVQREQRRAGAATEPRDSFMSRRTGLLALIATDTQSLVDHENAGGF